MLGLSSVDVGHGWLIFALPPSELACHPSEENNQHELYLMCDDVNKTIADLENKGVKCRPVNETRFGLVTSFEIPGGGTIGLYEPRHPTAIGKG